MISGRQFMGKRKYGEKTKKRDKKTRFSKRKRGVQMEQMPKASLHLHSSPTNHRPPQMISTGTTNERASVMMVIVLLLNVCRFSPPRHNFDVVKLHVRTLFSYLYLCICCSCALEFPWRLIKSRMISRINRVRSLTFNILFHIVMYTGRIYEYVYLIWFWSVRPLQPCLHYLRHIQLFSRHRRPNTNCCNHSVFFARDAYSRLC